MKGFIIFVIVVLIGYGFIQWTQTIKTNTDFAEKVDHQGSDTEIEHVVSG